ncbi:MAG: class I SAM-dependent methyltransferase [Gaiellales bacterium]
MTLLERIEAVGYDPAAVEREDVVSCNLCEATQFVELGRRDRYGYDCRLMACARCGLGFITPRPTAAAYGAFYRDVYRPLVSAYHGRRIDAETVQEEQRAYADDLRVFLERTLRRRPGSVLDIGGSTGVVGAAFRDSSTAITVLDPAPDELEVAAQAGLETVEGFAEDFDPAGRTWDLVLLCQTIDHLLDVRATLAAIRRFIGDEGAAFVDVLDVAWVLASRGVIEDSYKVDHPYYLTRATARAYFEKVGLGVTAERMADDGHWGFVLVAVEPSEPDWTQLRLEADAFLGDVWRRRAESG